VWGGLLDGRRGNNHCSIQGREVGVLRRERKSEVWRGMFAFRKRERGQIGRTPVGREGGSLSFLFEMGRAIGDLDSARGRETTQNICPFRKKGAR